MKKLLWALFLCLSLPVSALPSTFVVTQASLALSALCSLPTGSSSLAMNDRAEQAKEELNRALQNITCNFLNCTHLIIHDVKALGPMTNAQYNAWAASILQIIPDFVLFIPILIVPRLIPQSQALATAMAAVLWTQGLGTWIATLIYSDHANEGIPSYCNNSCASYKPYLDSTEFAELQRRAKDANSATTTAYRLSQAHGPIRIISLIIPLIAYGVCQYVYARVGEGMPLNVQ